MFSDEIIAIVVLGYSSRLRSNHAFRYKLLMLILGLSFYFLLFFFFFNVDLGNTSVFLCMLKETSHVILLSKIPFCITFSRIAVKV